MTVVIDLGCAEHDGDTSIPQLVERFKPSRVYGFDPLVEAGASRLNGTSIALSPLAAWIYDGMVELATGAPSKLDATIVSDKNDRGEWRVREKVPCFDFPAWLSVVSEPVVLKMNVEGAEFDLLERIHELRLDRKIELLIIQWHDTRMGSEFRLRRLALEKNLSCPIEEWTL